MIDRSESFVEWGDDSIVDIQEQEDKTAHLQVMEEYADETI